MSLQTLIEEDGVRCMLMRGGTSKGAYFLREDLPESTVERDDLLLRILGSPDLRQIDGIGGAHPLTSKVAVVSRSTKDDSDVDYLFLQVSVDEPLVSDRQNCGNLLAGIGPFAVERGLVDVDDHETSVRIRMVNSDGLAVATFATPQGRMIYRGETMISGAPFPAAGVVLDFLGVEGSTCGSLLPTGRSVDDIDGIPVTCIDNGMPVAVLRADDFDISGYETREELESMPKLKTRIDEVRAAAGSLMGLGDVSKATVPKITFISSPTHGGSLNTRTFIPHRCHPSIGVLGAITVATACLIPGTPAAELAVLPDTGNRISLEHPSGALEVAIDVEITQSGPIVKRAGVVNTARKLFDGLTYPRPPVRSERTNHP